MSDAITKLIEGPHLLYVSGDDVNFERVQAVVEIVPHFVLGPLCWLVRPPRDRNQFAERLQAAMPEAPRKSEYLLCPVSRYSMFHATQDGFGLSAWLKQYGGDA